MGKMTIEVTRFRDALPFLSDGTVKKIAEEVRQCEINTGSPTHDSKEIIASCEGWYRYLTTKELILKPLV